MSAPQQEYRIDELADAARIKVRTVRYYQERGLLPSPRREGRIVWYSQDHLARLRVISDLLERGHTLNGIGELLTAWEQGNGVAEMLGLERALTKAWDEEDVATLPIGELIDAFGDEATPDNIERAVALGYVTIEGETVTHNSRRLLESTLTLVRAGVPLKAVLETGAQLQAQMDRTATLFVELARSYLLGDLDCGHPLPPGEMQRIAEVVERLRPVARDVAGAEFARAMERRVRAEFGEVIGQLGAAVRTPVEPPPGGERSGDRDPG